MLIKTGLKVTVAVKLAVAATGQEIEKKVIEYVQGAGQMLPGFERAVEGLAAGAEKEGVIPAIEAFGAVKDLPSRVIRRAELPPDAQEGAVFAAKNDKGDDVQFRLEKLTAESAELRFLHPLADADISYHVKVIKVVERIPPPIPLAEDLLEES